MNDRRKFKRIECIPSDCDVQFELSQFRGTVVEESVGGLKISGLDLLVVPQDCPIVVRHLQIQQNGVVRSVSRNHGKFELGVELGISTENLTTSVKLLLGCFVYQGEHLVGCQPVSVLDGDRVCVLLWNGKETVADRNKLVPLSRKERAEILNAAPGHVQYLQSYYALNHIKSADLISTILEFEFIINEAVTTDS